MQNHDPERLPNGMGRVTSAEKGPTFIIRDGEPDNDKASDIANSWIFLD